MLTAYHQMIRHSRRRHHQMLLDNAG